MRKKWYTTGIESLTEAERFILTLIEQNLEDSKELGKGAHIMEEYIQEAIEVGEDFSFGESYDKEWAMREQEHRDGFEEGIQQGIQQKQVEIVKNMLKKNLPIDTIMEITGLSEEEIRTYESE